MHKKTINLMSRLISGLLLGALLLGSAATGSVYAEEQEPKEARWVISNEMGVNGAVSMLYDETLHKLSEKLGTDLYILPSSIHETIAISVEMGDPESLAEMVHQANTDVVALGDRLSNNVYHYDKDLRKLTLATDVPNKRLDGIVSEAPMVYEAGKSR